MSMITGKEGMMARPPLLPPPLATMGHTTLDGGGGGVGGGEGGVSAFRAVGSQLAVTSPAVRPATSPLASQGSPETGRSRKGTSDQDSASPTPSSTGSDSQPPTPVVPGPPQGTDAFSWPSHGAYDENRQLLGTEEESSEVGGSSEDEEQEKNVWLITQEQYSYYVTQFRAMQPNPRGLIPGTQAKEFFEKSRLPIQELRQIWQLSDVTKDGCLSLQEFLTAMHLVVLRRNDIPLPEQLPICLRPENLKQGVISRHHKDSSCSLLSDSLDGSREERRDTEATMSPQSQLSSPAGHKPVKFDFTAISAATDPSIACPVPLRLSPDSPYLQSSEEDEGVTMVGRQSKKNREVEYEQLWNVEDRPDRRLSSSSEEDTADEDLGGLSSSPSLPVDPGPLSLPQLGLRQESCGSMARTVLTLGKKEGLPPAPPARPAKSHARSSSLDLQAYHRRQAQGALPSLPSVPPRSSPFLRPQEFPSGPRDEIKDEIRDVLGRDTREISAEIHKYKESIALLSRTIAELGQEVSDTVEERVVLEYQLDQLKAIGTGGD